MTPLLRFITVFNLESHFRAIMKPWFREVLFILFNNITYLYRVDKPAEKGGGGSGGGSRASPTFEYKAKAAFFISGVPLRISMTKKSLAYNYH